MASAGFNAQHCQDILHKSPHTSQVLHLPCVYRRSLRLSRHSCRCRAAVEEQTQVAEKKQRVALGSVVIESTERFPNPEKDFWEGEQWEVHLQFLFLDYFLVLDADQPVDEALLHIYHIFLTTQILRLYQPGVCQVSTMPDCLQFVGKLAIGFVPLLVAFGVGVGIFAAATYNEGADGFVKP